jgi:LemA protein
MQFNTKVATFPANMLAGMFGFKERDFFELLDEVQREAPKVQF